MPQSHANRTITFDGNNVLSNRLLATKIKHFRARRNVVAILAKGRSSAEISERTMNEEIKVDVADYGAGRNLMLRDRCPLTGKQIAKSSGTRDQRKAVREAAKWEDQLRNNRYQKPSRMTWEAFRDHYTAHALPGLRSGR